MSAPERHQTSIHRLNDAINPLHRQVESAADKRRFAGPAAAILRFALPFRARRPLRYQSGRRCPVPRRVTVHARFGLGQIPIAPVIFVEKCFFDNSCMGAEGAICTRLSMWAPLFFCTTPR